MTSEQIMLQAWKMLGEPSDLNPSDITGTGRSYLLQGLNRAIRAVAFYKDYQTKEQFRFNQFRKEVYLKYDVTSGTGQIGGSTSVLVLENLPTGITDLTGAVVVIGDDTSVIGSNVGVTCQLVKEISATSTGAAYTVHPRWIEVPAGVEFIEVLKVEDMTNEVELQRSSEEEDHFSEILQSGIPANYYRIGRKIYFNVVPDEATYYRIWLFRAPALVTQGTETPELPESLHFGIVLWLTYWGYQWMNEPTDAYAAQNRFTNYMRTNRHELDMRNEMTDHYTLDVRAF